MHFASPSHCRTSTPSLWRAAFRFHVGGDWHGYSWFLKLPIFQQWGIGYFYVASTTFFIRLLMLNKQPLSTKITVCDGVC
jgi:hypothetical protein